MMVGVWYSMLTKKLQNLSRQESIQTQVAQKEKNNNETRYVKKRLFATHKG